MTPKEQYEKETGLASIEEVHLYEGNSSFYETEKYIKWLEAKFISHNSDYATALKVWDEFGEKADGMFDSQFGYWVTQRLKQSKD